MFRSAVFALTALALAAPAFAADERPAVLKALGGCRGMADNAQRLACYDREAGALLQSVEKKETVVLDKQEVRKTKRSLFGFSLPKLPFFGGGKGEDQKDEISQIEVPIQTVKPIGYGKFRFTVEDGATWETTEGINAFPKPGQNVVIKKGALGGYFIRFENTRAVKGMRVG